MYKFIISNCHLMFEYLFETQGNYNKNQNKNTLKVTTGNNQSCNLLDSSYLIDSEILKDYTALNILVNKYDNKQYRWISNRDN